MELSKTVATIEAKASAPATRELPLPANGDQDRFVQALEAVRIQNASVEQIKQVLRLVMVKIGLRAQNFPSKEETAILINHILKRYAGHTVTEIDLAFDLAMDEKLNLKEVSCFENFSCLYFSSVMNAYRAWAREEYKQIKTEVPMIENKESLSDQAMADWLKEVTARVHAGGYQVDYTPLALYEWMSARGEIRATTAEKRDYLVRAVDYRFGQLVENANTATERRDLAEFAAMRRAGEFTGTWVNHLQDLAKKMVLFDFISSIDQPADQRSKQI